MLVFVILVFLIAVSVFFFMRTARFGAEPRGARLIKMQDSPHYRNGQFQNLNPTPQLTEGTNIFGMLVKFFFDNKTQKTPPAALPSIKTDLKLANRDKNMLVWFGHSSYFLKVDGRSILVDPVFSGNASPLRFTTRSFKGSDLYTAADMPSIDYLVLTHDHWDHLDYRTVLLLKPRVRRIITGMGVADHLVSWGFEREKMIEMDWYGSTQPETGFSFTSMPARHFSGRGFRRNKSIWSSFVLKTPTKNIFIGGDSGYDEHFRSIGNQFGPFDLAILENGQYDPHWKYIHMFPEETVQAALDLRADKLLPVHWGKFSLSTHAWDDSIRRITREGKLRNQKILHPMIGEETDLDQEQEFSDWWESIQ